MRKNKSEITFQIANLSILIVFCLLIILPLLHILFASVSDPNWVRSYKGLIIFPRGFTLKGYEIIFENNEIFRSIFNSIFYMVFGTAINMVLSTIGAYVLSRKGVMLNKFFMIMITITMFFGGGVVPLYILLNSMNLIDKIWAILLPAAISPWNMIILRTAFQGVPEEICEAARIDGASELRMMVQISIPLIKATMAIILLYYAVGHWNSWFSAMAFIRDRSKYPLQLILRELLVVNDTSQLVPGGMTNSETLNYGTLVKYTTAVVSMLPMMILFPFVQKYFTQGVLVGAIK